MNLVLCYMHIWSPGDPETEYGYGVKLNGKHPQKFLEM